MPEPELTHKYTISFPESLWQNLIEVAGKGNVKQFIIQALKVALEGHIIKALVLAGGKGTSFRPISVSTPAVMHPIGYKPIIVYCLELLKKYSITDVVISVGYHKEHIQKHFSEIKLEDLKISFISEDEPLDTAGAVLNAKKEFKSTFLIMNGDVITNVNLRELIDFHHRLTIKQGGIVSMFMVPTKQAVMQGQIEYSEENGLIKKFHAKGKKNLDYVNGGIYVVEPDIFDFIKEKICSLEHDIFPGLANQRLLYGFQPSNSIYWNHVYNPENYKQGWSDFLAGKLNF